MNTQEAIFKRKSTRSYRDEQISDEALDAILKAGFASPVAMARYESLHITVLQNAELLSRINEMTTELFYKRSGVMRNMDFGAKTMVLVSSAHSDLPLEMEYVNVGIVMENMVLCATDMGIDSVILGGAPRAIKNDAEILKALGIPEGFTPILGVFLGYATNDAPAKQHKIAVNTVK